MPKQERKINDALIKRGYETFLPFYSTLRQWSDRKRRISLPLFPGYIFIRTHQTSRFGALQVPGVIRYLSIGGKPNEVSNDEIDLIRNIMPYSPQVITDLVCTGDVIKIKDGPLKGTEAVLAEFRSGNRICLKIESINKRVTIEVPPDSIQRIQSRSLVEALD